MGAFVITLREGFEAALIVGIVLAYLKKTGRLEQYSRTVWIGVGLAILTSVVVGSILFASVGELEGRSEELYEGLAAIFAAALVTWMVFWMRRQAATIGRHLRDEVDRSLAEGSMLGLATVAFIGVAREGLETALFLFASVSESDPVVTTAGAVLGLVVAIVLGMLFYRGALRLNLRTFFTITGLLVIVFAAYLIMGATHELGEVWGNEALEESGPLLALAYIAIFSTVYLRGLRQATAATA